MSLTRHHHKVLVATDLSESGDSDVAVRAADRWAREWSADLVAMHCVPIDGPVSPLLPQVSSEQQIELEQVELRAAEALTDWIGLLTGRAPDEYTCIIESGTPYVEIVRAAEEHEASLVVVGARGSSGLLRMLVGHSAEKVARLAPCPVLVVRPSPSSGQYMVATDLSEGATVAIQVAHELCRARHGSLTALFVVDSTLPFPLAPSLALPTTDPMTREGLLARAREELRAHLAALNVTAEPAISDGSVVAAMAHAAKTLPAELVIVGTIGRTGLTRALIGNTAEAVIRELPCSILVVRTRAPKN